jgi:hypothetical protein
MYHAVLGTIHLDLRNGCITGQSRQILCYIFQVFKSVGTRFHELSHHPLRTRIKTTALFSVHTFCHQPF